MIENYSVGCYVPGYEPNKYHSKYPFDNYNKINVLDWVGVLSMYNEPQVNILYYRQIRHYDTPLHHYSHTKQFSITK